MSALMSAITGTGVGAGAGVVVLDVEDVGEDVI